MEIVTRSPDSLKPHPLNVPIYGDQEDDSEFRRAIHEEGILAPLIIDQHGTILSGHRRWRAALALTLDAIPVVVREIADPLDALRLLLESNRQREKTPSQRAREAQQYKVIIAEEHRRAMLAGVTADGAGGRGKKKNPRPNSDEGYEQPSRTDAAVAEAVGMKRDSYRKLEHIHEAATGAGVPEAVKAVAQQALAAVDAGNATLNAAAKAVSKAEVAEKIMALPPGEPPADPFAARPKVRAARLVKNARTGLESVANNWLHYSPEEMIDAIELLDEADLVNRDLAEAGRWIADCQRVLKRRRSSLHVVS